MTVIEPHLGALAGFTAETLLEMPKAQIARVSFSAHSRRLVLHKPRGESVQHLVLKALLWSLLLPTYPDASCETDIGHRYRPDVIALSTDQQPLWWGECGSVSLAKLDELATTFPSTRLTVAKWGHSDASGYAGYLRSQLSLRRRSAPIEVLSFPADSVERFVSDLGEISLDLSQIQVVPVDDNRGVRGG